MVLRPQTPELQRGAAHREGDTRLPELLFDEQSQETPCSAAVATISVTTAWSAFTVTCLTVPPLLGYAEIVAGRMGAHTPRG
jgi:hypothetical protein